MLLIPDLETDADLIDGVAQWIRDLYERIAGVAHKAEKAGEDDIFDELSLLASDTDDCLGALEVLAERDRWSSSPNNKFAAKRRAGGSKCAASTPEQGREHD
jgi:hypothetical protein